MSTGPGPIHQGRIILAIILSFAISVLLMQGVFVDKDIHPNLTGLQKKADEFRTSIADSGVRLISTVVGLNAIRVSPTTLVPTLAAVNPTPQAGLAMEIPTGIPIPEQPAPTVVMPTFSLAPTDTPIPTAPPPSTTPPRQSSSAAASSAPSRPTATARPLPTSPPPPPSGNVPTFNDPLSQPWYGSKSGRCYAQQRFIQVYADGVTPDSCRKNVQAAIEKQLTTVKLLGRTITVHKKAAPAFQAVASALEVYKKDATHYDFPSSKNYAIRNVGAYVFRCNVNASTSGKFDTCSTGCVLSPHAFGIAVDINYDTNANGSNTYDMPKDVYQTFERYGFRWGGHYPLLGSKIDAMHFEYMVQLCEGI